VEPKSSEPPKARSKSPDDEDELPKEKNPRSFLEDFFRRLADGAVKNDLNPLGLDLPRLRGRSKLTLPEESDWRLLWRCVDLS
jgi:hypothetical protein